MNKVIIKIFLIYLLISCNKKDKLELKELNEIKSELLGVDVNYGRTGLIYINLPYDSCWVGYTYGSDYELVTEESRCSVINKKAKDSLLEKSRKAVSIIKKYKIQAYNESFKDMGILVKINCPRSKAYFQCDTTLLEGNWLKYVKKSTYLGEGWYYTIDK